MTTFFCARCHSILSKPLRHLDDPKQLQDQVGSDVYNPPSLVPYGFYILRDEVLAARKMWPASKHREAFAPLNEFIFNRDDLILHPTHINEKDVGCCGYTGLAGYNVFCIRGHAIGTEISDCCFVNYVHIPATNLIQHTD